jgi:Integrase core domain/Integrase zinc binding domain
MGTFLPLFFGLWCRRATKRLISSRFVWSKLAQQVTQWAHECLQCQRAKTHRHAQPTPAAIPVPAHRFSHVNIDIVGPLPSSSGFTHLLTIMDRRWPEALPLTSTTTAACAFAFVAGWISCFGVHLSLTSDRGPQFTSSLWSAVCSQLGISHTLMPAYHPQANGVVERFHRRLKDGLRAREAGADWYLHLPWVLLGIRMATADASSPSPALYGSQLVLPRSTSTTSSIWLTAGCRPTFGTTDLQLPQPPPLSLRLSSMPGWFWFGMTRQNRLCPRPIPGHMKFWSGLHLTSSFRSAVRLTLSPRPA